MPAWKATHGETDYLERHVHRSSEGPGTPRCVRRQRLVNDYPPSRWPSLPASGPQTGTFWQLTQLQAADLRVQVLLRAFSGARPLRQPGPIPNRVEQRLTESATVMTDGERGWCVRVMGDIVVALTVDRSYRPPLRVRQRRGGVRAGAAGCWLEGARTRSAAGTAPSLGCNTPKSKQCPPHLPARCSHQCCTTYRRSTTHDSLGHLHAHRQRIYWLPEPQPAGRVR